jgi:hypothetical protein
MDFQAHQDNQVTLDLKASQGERDKQVSMEDLVDEEIRVELDMLDHLVILSLFTVKRQQYQHVLTAWLSCGMVTVCCTWKEVKEHMVKI